MDASVFGYRWTEVESIISVEPVKNCPRSALTPTLSSRDAQAHQRTRPLLLRMLPLEVVHKILNYLDPASLAALRLGNSAISNTVSLLPAFREVTEYASDALRALSWTKLIKQHSIRQLHQALRSDHCGYCNAFGPYLYLLRCARCCYPCLHHNPYLESVTVDKVTEILDLSSVAAKSLAKMVPVPEVHNHKASEGKEGENLVSWESACSVISPDDESHTLSPVARHFRDEGPTTDGLSFNQHGICASMPFPVIGPQSKVQHGIWCRGCEDTYYYHRHHGVDNIQDYDAQNVAYSDMEFIQHCAECPGVKRLKDMNYPDEAFFRLPHRCYQERS